MSYLVLARKYRPQTFEEIIGQEHVTRTIQNAIAQGRVHHAFLFTGARGVGKTTAARILAKALSCDRAPTPTPCNTCDACREITQGSSVDVQEIDAASNNGVDHIRELRDSIRYAPVRGKKKVYVLDEVHMLSGGAWNALLKTLEEPPPHAVFVFATTDPHKLPATILSRVQRYDFKLVPSRRIVEHVATILEAEQLAFEPGALQLVARESGGSVRDSLSLLDQVIAAAGTSGLTESATAELLGVADRALLSRLARAVVDKDAAAALGLIDAAYARGYELAQLAQAFLEQLRDLVVAGVVSDPAGLIDASSAELDELKSMARTLPSGLAELLFDRFARVAEDVARSPLPRFVLEVGLVELTRVEPLQPISALLGQLEALEARLETGGAKVASGGSGSGSGPEPRPAPAPRRASSEAGPAPRAPRQAAPSPPAATVPPPQEVAKAADTTEPGPAAATPGAPPRVPIPGDFTSLVEAILETEPRLSALAQGRLIAWQTDSLSLGFDREFAAEGLRERLPQLRAALKKVTGRELAVEIVVGAPSDEQHTETLLEVEQRKIDEDRERRRREAIEHPARKSLDARFGGTWRDPVVDNVEE